MNSVSVIVPIFHGKKFIQGLIRQIEAAKKMLDQDDFVELVLVNDAPEDFLQEKYLSDYIEIVVLNTDHNRGIQGARIAGKKKSRGEYVIFLDQDDRIEPNYIKSQLTNIGDADIVVCRCIHEGKLYYNTTLPFEQMMNKEYMLKEGCPIISPGQALLRKSSISEVWMKNIMKINCADDFFLWLCMAGEGKRFALNQEVLFEHVVEYNNTSWDSYKMTASEREMAQILVKNHVFSDEETVLLNRMLVHIEKKRMEKLDRFRKMFYVLNDWTILEKTGSGIVQYLERQSTSNIALYGVGYLGKHLLWELEQSGICVKYLIDRNAAWMRERYPVYTLDDELPDADMIIITLVQDEKGVISALKKKVNAEIVTIMELVKSVRGEKRIW